MTLWGILANPVSGVLSKNARFKYITQARNQFGPDCELVGLDTTSCHEFRQAGNDLAQRVQNIVVAGGDGSVHDIIQDRSIASDHMLSVLPLGTGNALKYAFNIPWGAEAAANHIMNAQPSYMDLIQSDTTGEKGYMVSVGLDGLVLNMKNKLAQMHPKSRIFSFGSYALATMASVFWSYAKPESCVSVDGVEHYMPNMLSTILTKIPNYGMGLKVAPQTKLDDGLIHITAVNGGCLKAAAVAATSYMGGNRFGVRDSGERVIVRTSSPVYAQMDGEPAKRPETYFSFRVLPDAINWKA